MMFCPKCKSLLMPKLVDGKKKFVCSCGFKSDAEKVTISESAGKKTDIAIIEKEESVNVVIDANCPKCGPVKAEYWEIQMRAIDEPPTRFHKCKKCGHTWRENK